MSETSSEPSRPSWSSSSSAAAAPSSPPPWSSSSSPPPLSHHHSTGITQDFKAITQGPSIAQASPHSTIHPGRPWDHTYQGEELPSDDARGARPQHHLHAALVAAVVVPRAVALGPACGLDTLVADGAIAPRARHSARGRLGCRGAETGGSFEASPIVITSSPHHHHHQEMEHMPVHIRATSHTSFLPYDSHLGGGLSRRLGGPQGGERAVTVEARRALLTPGTMRQYHILCSLASAHDAQHLRVMLDVSGPMLTLTLSLTE
jgi:hypothetical protein